MRTHIILTLIGRWPAALCLAACCLLLLPMACTEEEFQPDRSSSGRAVRISASLPDEGALSKAAAPKESFAKDDVIHVYALFTLDGTPASATAYACMKYDGAGNWTAADGTTLDWPWNATRATFTAYYIPPVTKKDGTVMKNNTAMNQTAGQNALSFSLSELTAEAVERGTDPMKATYQDIPAESAVHLQFNHLFAKLTFTGLGQEPNYTGSLTEGETLYLEAPDLTDSCAFIRQEGGDALSHTLASVRSYLSGRVEPDAGGAGYAVTFLVPEVAPAGIDYKLYFKDFSPYHLVPVKQALEPGKHYSLDITRLADNYWADDLKEEAWNEHMQDVELTTADINQYLTAIRDGLEFRKNGLQVLDVYTATEGGKTTTVVTQLRNVDFGNRPFTPVSISTNIIFQGNAHKIKNLSVQASIDENGAAGGAYQALFGKNEGTIKNLILEGAKVVSLSGAEYVGSLVGLNLGTGKIEDVRIDFNPGDYVQGSVDATYVGGLVGVNEGTITGCTLRGNNFQVSVAGGAPGKNYYAGGMIGYNSGASSTVQGARIQAENARVGYTGAGSYVYIGGWAGYSDSRKVEACSSSMGVQAGGGGQVRAGGFVGGLYGAVEKCAATGPVTLNASSDQADAGGFAGLAVNVKLDACYATGAIIGTAPGAKIGGFAGRIVYEGTGASDVLNCFAIGQVPAAADGGFAAFAGNLAEGGVSDKTKVTIRNCFSRGNASAFLGNDGAMLGTVHHNGSVDGSPVTTGTLNGGRPADGFEWVDRPALYGAGFPYFIID